MNATQNRPETAQQNEHQNLIVQIHHIRQTLTSGSGLRNALAELERLVPVIASYVGSESLASQSLDVAERNRREERVSEIRSKVRELQALLDSGRRLIEEGTDSEGVALRSEALSAYLLPTLADTAEVLESRCEALAVATES